MPAKLSSSQRTAITPEAKLSQGVLVNTDLSKMGAGLTRGPKQSAGNNNAPWTNSWPATGATLDIDFVNNKGFVRGIGQGGAFDAITYTRASNGTYVGSDGLLKGSGSDKGALGLNLLTFPQNFENAIWSKNTAVTVIANATIAPDGTNTADKLIATNVNTQHSISPADVNLGTCTRSVYMKAGEAMFGTISAYYGSLLGYAGATFNLLLGTILVTTVGDSATITSVGNGWYRCTLTTTKTGTTGFGGCQIRPSNGSSDISTTYTGDGTSGIFIWGAQLELGSSATTYFPTNINTPRIDWASTAQLPQNYLYYTDDFRNTTDAGSIRYWAYTAVTVTANSTTAPDGTSTADTIIGTNSTTAHYIGTNFTSNPFYIPLQAGTWTLSFYLKSAGRQYIQLGATNSGITSCYANFDIINGVAGTLTSGCTSSISNSGLPSGWYRCSLTFTATITSSGPLLFICHIDSNTAAYGANSTCNGVDGVYAWGSQFELGSSPSTFKANTGLFSPSNTPLLPTTTANGYLNESASANALLWCRDATNAEWVSTNVTTLKDQIGIDGVASACSSLTSTNANGTCIQTVTSASAVKTSSVYLKRITGTGTIQVTMDGTTWSTVDLSNGIWNRIVISATLANPVIGIKIVTSGDAVALDYGQIEASYVATSPILTTTASATRAQDVSNMKGVNFNSWFNQTKGTLYCNFVRYNQEGVSNTAGAILSIDDGGTTFGTGQIMLGSPSAFEFGVRANYAGGNINSFFTSNSIQRKKTTLVACYSVTKALNAINGLSGFNSYYNLNYTFLKSIQLGIGMSGNTFVSFNGTISRIIYVPYEIPLEGLKNMTAGNT
ncbi:hypothetical protein UFOVP84_35 [uncultured Caudovirales phage]|uniref:Uncharacterized protein n=1 Tax=uncultured Caudovirales phage TaxID=2100421 RepID=A0A6J5KY13_9CAUD|nr:hypothetical protein UFOVP84_35 [uncultured Caudovirales phage]